MLRIDIKNLYSFLKTWKHSDEGNDNYIIITQNTGTDKSEQAV